MAANPGLAKTVGEFALKQAGPMLTSCIGKVLDSKKAHELATRYSASLVEKVGLCKTFLNHDKPQHIIRAYQPVGLSGISRSDGGTSIKTLLKLGRFVAIVGHAGAGKSMILKRLCYDAIDQGSDFPIFLEMRRLVRSMGNGTSREAMTIRAAISEAVFGMTISDASGKLVDELLSKSKTIIFLDGFDELPIAHRSFYANELLMLSERHQESKWIVTSRPDEMITRMNHVVVTKPQPLTLEGALLHISRYDIDTEQQSNFSELLKKNLFKEHNTFASNPLLLSVLFLSFRTYERISDRPHIFFEEIFDALCTRHDLRKGGFERELFSGLSKEIFVPSVRLFCFLTLLFEIYTFRRDMLDEEIETVISQMRLACKVESLRKDYVQSISLLTEDGQEYTFLHRSLQEFLAAKYISTMPKKLRPRAMARVSADPIQSLALIFLLNLDPNLVEEVLVLPLLRDIENIINVWRLDVVYGFIRTVATLLPDIDRQMVITLPDPWDAKISLDSAVELIDRIYPGALGPLHPRSGAAWWLDSATGSIYETTDKIVTAGQTFFGQTGHLGAASALIGISQEAAKELPEFRKEVEKRITNRRDTKESLNAFLAEMIAPD